MAYIAVPAALIAGLFAGVVATLLIVRHKRRQRDLESKHLQERLIRTSRLGLIACVASEMAHEVNQPLAAIAMYADAAKMRLKNDAMDQQQLNQLLSSVTEQSHRASDIIQAIRKLVDRNCSVRQFFKISDLVFSLQPIIELDAEYANVKTLYHIKRNLPPVYCDAVQIQLVILSLARNGIDEMQDSPVESKILHIHADLSADDTVRVEVKDQGQGVPVTLKPKLFKPYFSTKKDHVGMSLSVAQSIIAAHDGKIGYTQTDSGGSNFWFTIPVS